MEECRARWYRKKSYPHFDSPMSYEKALAYVSNPENIKQHSFLPFLSFEIKVRRFSKKDPKRRPIKYAAHRDGYIFSYYAHILSRKYEDLLQQSGLSEVVLAYRSGRGNNIDFAKEAFDQIEQRGNCAAIGFDISSFFDNIDHSRLKQQWATLLGLTKLPDDHYAVYRAITKYSWVDKDQCYKRLGYSRQDREQKRPICNIQEFRDIIKGRGNEQKSLVQTNKVSFGIPQGSSISALLANLYLYPFDKQMHILAQKIGGMYRRYSDDILWVCPTEYEDLVKTEIKKKISEMGKQLQIQDEKTTISHFVKSPDGTLSLRDGDKPFQYLGFTFDGKRRLMRAQTLSRFWRKVVFSVRRAKKNARKAGRKARNSQVFKRKLYKRFSHLGNSNFLGYAKRSARTMADGIAWKEHNTWQQVKNHWHRLNQEIQKPLN